MGERLRTSTPSLRMLFSNLHMVTNPEALNPVLWGFLEASLHRLYGLNHWSLVDSTSNPSPLPKGQERREWKFQPSNHSVGSPSNQPPSLGGAQISPYLHNRRYLYPSHHLRNSKGLRALCQKWRWKPNICIFFLLSVTKSEPYTLLLWANHSFFKSFSPNHSLN